MPTLPSARTVLALTALFAPSLATGLRAAPATPATPVASASEEAQLAYFRDLAETRNYTLGAPRNPTFPADGQSVLYLRGGPRDPVLRLYELDLTSNEERELITPAQLLGNAEETLSAEEKARRERARMSLKGFTAFQLSKDGKKILVTLSGRLFTVDRHSLKSRELPGSGWLDPRFSPDGTAVAAVKGGELHLIDLASGTAKALTSGATDTLSHGDAEFVAQEEMGRSHGYWWSPDSRTLLYQETDSSDVPVRYVADPLNPNATATKFFYPNAGAKNARVRLGLIARDGGPTTWVNWDREAYPYLARVVWKEPGTPATLIVQDRLQQTELVLAVDATTGATRELLRETDAAWVDLDDGAETPLWLKDGSGFLWTTERNGAWQIEHRAADGKLVRALTDTAFGYRGIAAIDAKRGSVYVNASPDPREIHLWRVPLAGGAPQKLTREPGVHGAVFDDNAARYAHSYNLADGRNGWELISAADGMPIGTLPSVAEEPKTLPVVEHVRTAGERSFDASLVRPRAFDKHRKYPVILQVYAGPTSKTVMSPARGYFNDQWLADQGYIVVRLDGRGTPWRGRDWLRAVRGNFIDIALEDQVAGLRALGAAYPELDLDRVGVTGWSFGGYFTAMATIRRPDVFKAGVSGAPVITWENYDTHYTERYLGLPQTSPEAYKVSNVTTYAGELKRPLLLIHGLTDDNVYFQHTLQLADALYMAGKPYELLPMLGTHMVSDPLVKLRQQQRIVAFFDRALK